MEVNKKKNYLLIEFVDSDESKWKDILDYVLTRATHVEFNILYSDSQLKEFMKEYESSIVEVLNKKEKIYSSGKVLRMHLTKHLKEFVIIKSFSDYYNWCLEDPSFYIDDNEIVATITHEDQIYLNPNFIDSNCFPNFKFEHKLLEEKKIGYWRRFVNLFTP